MKIGYVDANMIHHLPYIESPTKAPYYDVINLKDWYVLTAFDLKRLNLCISQPILMKLGYVNARVVHYLIYMEGPHRPPSMTSLT